MRYFLRWLIFCATCLVSSTTRAQFTSPPDSLYSFIDVQTPDTTRAGLLLKIAEFYIGKENDSVLSCAMKSLAIYERIEFKRGMARANCFLGDFYASRHIEAVAASYFQKAQELYDSGGLDDEKGRLFGSLGRFYFKSGQYDVALDYFEKADKQSRLQNDSLLVAENLHNWANLLNMMGDSSLSTRYLMESIRINERLMNMPKLCSSYGLMSMWKLNWNRLQEAETMYQKALHLAEQNGLSDLYGIIQLIGGDIRKAMGRYEAALECYEKARQKFESLGNKGNAGLTNTKTGEVYLLLRQFDRAEAYFLTALEMSREHTDWRREVSALSKLGLINLEYGRPENAKYYFEESVAVQFAHTNEPASIENYMNLAHAELLLENNEQALLMAGRAFELADSLKQNFIKGPLELLIGKCYLALNQLKESRQFLNAAYQRASESADILLLAKYFDVNASWYERKGELSKALESYRRYSQLTDSLFTLNLSSKAGDYLAMYWAENKQHELEMANLTKKIQEQELQAARQVNAQYETQRNYWIGGGVLIFLTLFSSYRFYNLRQKGRADKKILEAELKALRAQMNPHFLFNALNGVQGMINKSDLRTANLFLSKCAALSRAYLEQSEHSHISLETELSTIQQYLALEGMRFDFTYTLSVDEEIETELVQVPSMLLQPYVENAVIHGLRPLSEPGVLKIQVIRKGEEIWCMVEDNGVGRSAGKRKESQRYHSMGMKITARRIRKYQSGDGENVEPVIKDLSHKDGSAAGTQVQFPLPRIAVMIS